MFITTANSKVVALDAATGHERWKFDPYAGVKRNQPRASGGVNRGVAYWSDGKKGRVFLGAADGRLDFAGCENRRSGFEFRQGRGSGPARRDGRRPQRIELRPNFRAGYMR